MCHWRRVRNHYKRCGHYIDLVSMHTIQCDDRYCKFSTTHPRNCVPPRCTETCWQYRQFPQQYNPVIDDFCPSCITRGAEPTGNSSKYA
ncbi:hypothetical protein K474DRAFT_1584993 [Panus rudis PR-1116 ss-1]|nr:hypothetical protein K474DRAFT_1584993 [Panus rudis PR-1116 ss-1]